MWPEKINLFKDYFFFFARIISRRIENNGSNINSQLKDEANESLSSLAFDELI